MSQGAPRATYRLQLSPTFSLDDAAGLVEQLDALGISHIYLSPVLAAVPGSSHGYDVADPGRVNDEIGGAPALRRLAAAARARGMGLLLDIVPNHMAADAQANPWWRDLLEDGRLSPFAAVFDIDWDGPDAGLRGRVLVPVLGSELGDLVGSGEVRLDSAGGRVWLSCPGHRLPLSPTSLAALLAQSGEEALTAIATRLDELAAADPGDAEALRRRRSDRLDAADRLAAALDAGAGAALAAVLERLNHDPGALLDLLERQNWLLTHWREAAWRINYRRFFSIAGLVGVRVEDPAVMELTHRLVAELVAEGVAAGLRIDHVDGLRDPRRYLERLAELSGGAWTVVEKILGWGEQLPEGWPVAGTTGYEAGALLTQLFTDPAGEDELTALDEELRGAAWEPEAAMAAARLEVMAGELAADVERLAARLPAAAAAVPDLAGRPRPELRDGIAAVLAGMPVYRTYIDPAGGEPADLDRAVIAAAVAAARRAAQVDEELLWAIEAVLGGAAGGAGLELVGRFQQTSPAVMAKGVEDTAFYRLVRLASLAEVGGTPERFGIGVESFHAACARVQERWPGTLVSTSSHDTKRSEDVRARLGVLSELAGAWAAQVRHWRVRNAGHGFDDPAVEHLIYQLMVGAHPLERDRAVAVIEKSVREAKLRTSWAEIDEGYEGALTRFVDALHADAGFQAELDAFAQPVARWGRLVSLAQTLVKLTMPGVPDIYWGNELIQLDLVDPDNRRPVDFELRRRMIDRARSIDAAQAMADEAAGMAKLFVTVRALGLRRRLPGAFSAAGGYTPLRVVGAAADRALAFARGTPAEVVTVVPRLVAGTGGVPADVEVELPAGPWRDQLTGAELAGGEQSLEVLLAGMPVALLARPG